MSDLNDPTHRSATISVLVDNESGVLARVIGLFAGRGYNIDSLTVAAVGDEGGLSRINVVTSGTAMVIEQIKAQLDRLIPVHKVADLTRQGPHVAREMALVKVVAQGENRLESPAHRRCVPGAGGRYDDRELRVRTDRRDREDRRFYRVDAAYRACRGIADGDCCHR